MIFSSKKANAAIQALAEELATLQKQVAEQRQLLEEYVSVSFAARDSIAAIDARITGLGSELSHQLHELGNDIERLSLRADDTTLADSVAALKSSQIRLATEQARYQITFRHDLAELAQLLQKRSN